MMNVYGIAGTAEAEFYLFNVIGDPELKPWFYAPSLLHVSPRSLTFEQTMVGKMSRNQWVNLRNLGEQNLQIQNMTTSSTSFIIEVKGKLLCGSTSPVLDTFGECNIFVNFRPTQAKTYRDSLNITYNNGKTISIPLYGTGIPKAPDIRVSYGSCTSFGNVQVGQTSRPCRVSIHNDGLNNLNARIAPNTELAFEWRREGNRACEDATPVIAPGNSCDITVYFKPIKPGYQKSNLRIYSDDPDTPEVTIPLDGHGLSRPVISPKSER